MTNKFTEEFPKLNLDIRGEHISDFRATNNDWSAESSRRNRVVDIEHLKRDLEYNIQKHCRSVQRIREAIEKIKNNYTSNMGFYHAMKNLLKELNIEKC